MAEPSQERPLLTPSPGPVLSSPRSPARKTPVKKVYGVCEPDDGRVCPLPRQLLVTYSGGAGNTPSAGNRGRH
jgi:hypothetical protein